MTISRETVEGGDRAGYKVACRTCPSSDGKLYYLGDSASRILEENGYAEYLAVRHNDLWQGNHEVVVYKFTGSPKAE